VVLKVKKQDKFFTGSHLRTSKVLRYSYNIEWVEHNYLNSRPWSTNHFRRCLRHAWLYQWHYGWLTHCRLCVDR